MGEQKTGLILLLILVLLAVSIPEINVSKAQSGTLVVPDDYPTIASAIGNATEGDTVFVKRGTYEGPINQTLVINKTISLVGEDPETTILNLHPRYVEPVLPFDMPYYEDALAIEANDVLVSGLNISSLGGNLYLTGQRTKITCNIIATGLFLATCYTNISNNIITIGIWCSGSHNVIVDNRIINRSIIVSGGGSNRIYGNTILNCNTETAGYGIRLDSSDRNSIFNNTIKNCSHAVSLLGISSSNSIYANMITNNTGGLDLFGHGSNNVFYDNYVVDNQYGVLLSYTFMASPGENNTVYHNDFLNNVEQINTSPLYYGNYGSAGATYPTGNYDNGKEGNYWSDYNGTDNNGDGIGDTPYRINENRQDNYPLMERITNLGFQSSGARETPLTTSITTVVLIVIVAVIATSILYLKKMKRKP